MRTPQMSGWCSTVSILNDGTESHTRCTGGNRANPFREFQPCPCQCHYPDEEYECECGGVLKEAPLWPQEDEDMEGEPVYTHIDPRTGRALGEECS